MRVNTSDQLVIDIVRVDTSSIIYNLLVIDNYINLITLQTPDQSYPIHDQIYINFEYSNLPSLVIVTNYTFDITSDSVYNFVSLGVATHILLHMNAAPVSIVASDPDFSMTSNGSYIISLPPDQTQNLTLDSSYAVTVNIILPCSLDIVQELNYSLFIVNSSATPNWATLNSAESTLTVDVTQI